MWASSWNFRKLFTFIGDNFFPRICFSQLHNFTLGLFINGIDRYKGGGDEQKGLCFYRNWFPNSFIPDHYEMYRERTLDFMNKCFSTWGDRCNPNFVNLSLNTWERAENLFTDEYISQKLSNFHRCNESLREMNTNKCILHGWLENNSTYLVVYSSIADIWTREKNCLKCN